MTAALEITSRRESTLLDEFCAAIRATSTRDLQSWGGRSIEILGQVTVRRGSNFKALLSSTYDFLSDEVRGLLEAIRNDRALPHLQQRSRTGASNVETFGRDFYKFCEVLSANLKNRPRETAPKMVAAVLGFLVGSGGVDGDGGIPDLDLLAGIGAHRSILTHSVISGIVAETAVLSVLDLSKTIYRNLPEKHDPLWEDLCSASDDIFAAVARGMSVGIAYHLAIDATIDGEGTYKDLPIEPLPAVVHQTILVGNAAAEGVDAAKRGGNDTVNEVEGRVFATFREASEFAKRETAWVIIRATDGKGFRLVRKIRKAAK